MELGITGIHHVQIGVRPEDEAACRRFYVRDPAGVRVEFAQVRRA